MADLATERLRAAETRVAQQRDRIEALEAHLAACMSRMRQLATDARTAAAVVEACHGDPETLAYAAGVLRGLADALTKDGHETDGGTAAEEG